MLHFFKKGVRDTSIYGSTRGLKPLQIKRLEQMGRRKIKTDQVIPFDMARRLAALSHEIKRQVGLLIGRDGTTHSVLVGNQRQVLIPELSAFRLGKRPLRGLRLIHTHLKNEALSQEDLTDLALLRLDLIAAMGILPDGAPGKIYLAHLLPANPEGRIYEVHPPLSIHQLKMDVEPFLKGLEAEFSRQQAQTRSINGQERAILISASQAPRIDQEDAMDELADLAHSARISAIDRVIQRPKTLQAKTLLGEGKLKEVIMRALQKQAELLIFDQNLSPLQVRTIGEVTEMKVLDRTQLILDIFAQRAHSREAKVQVELAQLRYRLPRLAERSTALSRLTGGIGGRGPGETRLEVDRRRARDRIARLERELKVLTEARARRRQKRRQHRIPILSIVGYTNAGKSTLLNALTQSHVATQDLLFATLDTATRRLRFPKEREVIITDTVGFIQSLPPDLLGAFRSTLDELQDAQLLIHLVDICSPRLEQQIETVKKILDELDLGETPTLLVFNKADRIGTEKAEAICARYRAIGLSALHPESFDPLLKAIENALWGVGGNQSVNPPSISNAGSSGS